MIDTNLLQFATDRQRQIIEEVNRLGSARAAAKAMNISRATVQDAACCGCPGVDGPVGAGFGERKAREFHVVIPLNEQFFTRHVAEKIRQIGQ